MKPLLRFPDLVEIDLVNNWTTLNNWIAKRGFPSGRMVGRCRMWTEREVFAWIESQPTENKTPLKGLEAKNRPPNPCRFKFERVNEVTLKLTNGELTDVPASHGQWGGYRATKAIAWVICLVPGKWLARCGDMVCGP